MDRRVLHVVFLAALVGAAAGAAAGESRPAFPAIEVSDLTGQAYPLKNFLGTVTVLNFWATWCGPCRLEMPELQKLSNELGAKGLVVLAVDVDLPPISEEGISQQLEVVRPRVQMFLSRAGVTLPVYLIDGKTQAALEAALAGGLGRIPCTVLLDREGGVVRTYYGYSPEYVKDLRQQALGVLAERSVKGGK
jgi:thiol-disulfide isomerase/thioredoxin